MPAQKKSGSSTGQKRTGSGSSSRSRSSSGSSSTARKSGSSSSSSRSRSSSQSRSSGSQNRNRNSSSGSKGRNRNSQKTETRPVRREVGAAVCVLLGVFALFGLFGIRALFINFYCSTLKGLFGYGFWLIPPALFLAAFILAFHHGRPVTKRLVCALLLPLLISALIHGNTAEVLPWDGELVQTLWKGGEALKGGGVLGGLLGQTLVMLVSDLGCTIVMGLATVVTALAVFDKSLMDISDWLFNRPHPAYVPEPPRERRRPQPAVSGRYYDEYEEEDRTRRRRSRAEEEPERRQSSRRQEEEERPERRQSRRGREEEEPEPERRQRRRRPEEEEPRPVRKQKSQRSRSRPPEREPQPIYDFEPDPDPRPSRRRPRPSIDIPYDGPVEGDVRQEELRDEVEDGFDTIFQKPDGNRRLFNSTPRVPAPDQVMGGVQGRDREEPPVLEDIPEDTVPEDGERIWEADPPAPLTLLEEDMPEMPEPPQPETGTYGGDTDEDAGDVFMEDRPEPVKTPPRQADSSAGGGRRSQTGKPPAPAQPPVPLQPDVPELNKVTREEAKQAALEVAQDIQGSLAQGTPPYRFPPLDLLSPGSGDAGDQAEAELRSNRQRLTDTIRSFNIDARIVNVTRGPSVTRYELELDQGVRLNKLTNLADDIALSLGASGVRIAPIPDQVSMVGIEVPNKAVTPVNIHSVLSSRQFTDSRSKVSFAVGKDISGRPVVGDIAKMPHMLIAGTTGSGKSVCTNSLIISLLYKSTPEEVRLIMVDPKMVELGIYNGIPHLLIPVVTDPKKAAGALQWAVTEMMKRYRTFSDVGVRELSAYNDLASKTQGLARMPQIVVIIDELADLMLVAAKEVEESICRVAQMGRAAGMHLVIATQRPSSDVITGLMKANIPSRIAFAVASSLESRIILDTTGAEKLVGRGDMLYAPLGSGKPMRVQGCLITDQEVASVVSFVKHNGDAQYDDMVMEEIEHNTADREKGSGKSAGGATPEELGDDFDELIYNAAEVVVETGQASVSMLQRRLKLGYARAARMVDQLEQMKIVGPFEGSKPRQLLINREQWAEMKYRLGITTGMPGEIQPAPPAPPAPVQEAEEEPDQEQAEENVS